MIERLPRMIAAALPVVVTIPLTSPVRAEGAPLPDHHHNGIYRNPWPSYIQVNPTPFTLFAMLKDWKSKPVSC